MAKLTKAQFNKASKPPVTPGDTSEDDKQALCLEVYEWQQKENIYAWDEEALQEDLGISISNFILAGEVEKGNYVEVEFFQPLDQDSKPEGVACGYKLIRLQEQYYNLQKLSESTKDDK